MALTKPGANGFTMNTMLLLGSNLEIFNDFEISLKCSAMKLKEPILKNVFGKFPNCGFKTKDDTFLRLNEQIRLMSKNSKISV